MRFLCKALIYSKVFSCSFRSGARACFCRSHPRDCISIGSSLARHAHQHTHRPIGRLTRPVFYRRRSGSVYSGEPPGTEGFVFTYHWTHPFLSISDPGRRGLRFFCCRPVCFDGIILPQNPRPVNRPKCRKNRFIFVLSATSRPALFLIY